MVGCGNSSMPICFYLKEIFIELSEDMYNSQYTNITNIDISDVVIEKMKKIYSESMPLMKCICKNVNSSGRYYNGCIKYGFSTK
jgi:hypothetical protein